MHVQEAFRRLAQFYDGDISSQAMKARILGELEIALNELQAASVELHEQNEELVASRRMLEEERTRYQELFDFAPDGYLVTDAEGIILEANNAAASLFRVSRSFLLGNSLALFVEPGGRSCFRTRLAKMKDSLAMSSQGWELDMQSRYRSPFPVSITVGKVMATATHSIELRWLLRDITSERQTAREQLQQSESRFSKSFGDSPVAMCIISNIDDRYIDCNQHWEQLTGYSREESIGKTAEELNQWTKQARDDLGKTELELQTKSGETRYAVLTASAIQFIDEPCRLVVAMDVTAEKKMGAEIARLDRLNLVGEMAAGIGHEIRNPMTTVRGFIQLLGGKEEYQQDRVFFDLILEEMDRANSIISEYLSMAKDKRVELHPMSIDTIVQTLLPMIQSDSNLRELNIAMDLNNPPDVLLDENEIRQLIINMTRNGLEAMKQGGTLTIGTRREGSDTVLFIKDEGPGFDQLSHDKLGTPFYSTKDNGTGLGLPICYSIAARHQARIDCETGPSGTTFYVRFPPSDELSRLHLEENGRGGL